MDSGVCWVIVHRTAKSQTWLKWLSIANWKIVDMALDKKHESNIKEQVANSLLSQFLKKYTIRKYILRAEHWNQAGKKSWRLLLSPSLISTLLFLWNAASFPEVHRIQDPTFLSLSLYGLVSLHQLLYSVQFSSVHLISRVWFFMTPSTAACQASLSITNSWSLLKLMSIQSVMPSNHLILCHLLLLLPSTFPSITVFSHEPVLPSRWPKVEIQLQHQSFQWIFRTDFL